MKPRQQLIQWHGQPNSEIVSSEPSAGGSEVGDDRETVSESVGVGRNVEASGNAPLISGGVRREAVACSTCDRCFTSTGAMRVHARAAHPVEYHATCLTGLRCVKPRWSEEESRLLAKKEAEL